MSGGAAALPVPRGRASGCEAGPQCARSAELASAHRGPRLVPAIKSPKVKRPTVYLSLSLSSIVVVDYSCRRFLWNTSDCNSTYN